MKTCNLKFIFVSGVFGWIFIGTSMVFAQETISSSTAPAQSILTGPAMILNNSTEGSIKEEKNIAMPKKPKYVRGVHLTAWLAGSTKGRERIFKLLKETEINTVVIDIKEIQGEVYIPGVNYFEKEDTFVPAIPKVDEYLQELKKRGVYTIARIVVFKDNLLPRKRHDLAVKNKSDGAIWQDRAGIAWVDPFNRKVWEYNIAIAKRAAELGFDEIQFDYIRFPSDGNIRNCLYSKTHTPAAALNALVEFLKESNKELKKAGAYVSIDVFGLTTTNVSDMGIGQKIIEMSEQVDFVSPMVYPSHYYKGEYGIPEPEKEPYDTVYLSLKGAKKRFGESSTKLRPYLQDFSMKHHYGAKQVEDQIQAAYDNDIGEWILWNPSCRYTLEALKTKEFSESYEKSNRPEPKMRYAEYYKLKASSSTATALTPAVLVSSFSIINSTQPAKTTNLLEQTTDQIK